MHPQSKTLSEYLDQSFVATPAALCAHLGSETRAKVLSFIYQAWQTFKGIEVHGQKYVYLSYSFIGERIWRKIASTRRAVLWLEAEGYLIRGQYLKHRFNEQLAHHREYCYRLNLEKLEILHVELQTPSEMGSQAGNYSLFKNQRSCQSDPRDQTTKIPQPKNKKTNKEWFSTDLTGYSQSSSDIQDSSPTQHVSSYRKTESDIYIKNKNIENMEGTKQTNLDPVLEEIIQSLKNMGIIVNQTILKLLQDHSLDRILNARAALHEAIAKGIKWRIGPNAWLVRAIERGFKPTQKVKGRQDVAVMDVVAPCHKPYVPRPELMPISQDLSSVALIETIHSPNSPKKVPSFSPAVGSEADEPMDLSRYITAIKVWAKQQGLDINHYCRERFRQSWATLGDDALSTLYQEVREGSC